MTTPSTSRKAGPLLGTGSQTAWPFTFKVYAAGDVKVTTANSAGVEATLVLNTDYTVALNSNQDTSPGGTVTYPISGSALPVGSLLAIVGDLDYDQPLDLPSGGNFSPLALENQLDRSTMQIQQLREEMDRTAKLPATSLESVEALVDDLQRIADSAGNMDIVAENITSVNVVAADLSEPVSEINTVAVAIANVNTVGNNITNVNTVAGIAANVNTVAGIAANVTAVAGNAANITAVAGNATNINAVNANKPNIDVVAGNATNINAVNANKTNIDAVAGINANVTTVAGIAAAVSTTAANVADITNFSDVYQGPKASDPTLRNNGSALQQGDLYFNTVEQALRAYGGTQWVAGTAGSVNVQRFSGDGSDTTFTLASAPAGENNTQVFIGGVYQQKDSYSVSGTTLTFSSAPPSGTNNIEVVTIATLALGETDAALVSFLQAGTGAVERTMEGKGRDVASILDFIPPGTDTENTDCTAYFNLASLASQVYGSNVWREIELHGKNYRILGTVYLRKGQQLSGGGAHLFMSSTGSIKCGLKSDNTEDSGGAPVFIKDVWFEGGLTPIDCQISGYTISNCFFSSSASGPIFSGTDGLIDQCVFDDGSTLVNFSARNSVMNNCNFYIGNNQILLGSCDNSIISNCVFSYADYAAVSWTSGAVNELKFIGCTFMKNVQTADTFQGFVYTGGGASISGNISFSACEFRNCPGGAMRLDAATANYRIDVNDCIFDGTKTNPAYVQSSTMCAIDMATGGSSKGAITVTNSKFRNLHQTPIQIGGNETYTFKIRNCEFQNNAGTRSIEVAGTNSSAYFEMGNIVGDGKNLIDFTAAGTLNVVGWLKNWLTETLDGSNRYVAIPFSGATLIDVTLIANGNPGGNGNYRSIKSKLVSATFDYQPGTGFNTQITSSDTFTSSSTYLGINLSITAELNSVGSGTQVSGLNAPGKIILYCPSGYADRKWDVQYKNTLNI